MDHTNSPSSTLDPEVFADRNQVAADKPPISQGSTRWSWLVLGLIALVYMGTSFAPVIFDDNEGLYAGAVREMHQSGNWLLPTVNGFPRVQKPPLVYWTMLVSTSVLGGSEFALRLPNALATVGWIVATYLIMRRLGGERFGLASAMVVASMLGVWIFNHLVQPEPFLACFISLAIWCLVEARLSARPHADPVRSSLVGDRFPGDHWYLLFWISLALGALSKGLHGALWPLGTVLLAAIFVPGLRPWLKPVLTLRGIVVFFALLTPWYIYMAAHLPGFLAAHFINEQLGASLNIRYPSDARQLPLAQFYGQHLLFWMPWTLLLPASIYLAVKTRRTTQSETSGLTDAKLDLVKMLGWWFVLTQVSVAFSTRQDYYSMSCWGVVAGFLAMPWTIDARIVRLPRAFLVVPCALVLTGGALALGLSAWVAPRLASLGEGTASPISDRDTFMDAIAGISPGLWGHFITLLAIFGAVMLVGGTMATVLASRRNFFAALLVLSGAMIAPICLATAGFTMMGSYFSLASEASVINAEIAGKPDALVVCEGEPHTASSLYYYLNARVHWVDAVVRQDYPQRVLGLGLDLYWNDAGLQAAWRSEAPVYFIIDQSKQAYWQAMFPGARVVNKSGTRLVLCNR